MWPKVKLAENSNNAHQGIGRNASLCLGCISLNLPGSVIKVCNNNNNNKCMFFGLFCIYCCYWNSKKQTIS